MIPIEQRIDVASSVDRVWAVLSDPRTVVGCVPGAAIVGESDDGTFDATLGVKFGPMHITFKARVALAIDNARRSGELSARGKDATGGTQLRARATFEAIENAEAAGTTVRVNGVVEIGGRLANIIEGGATIVVARLSREFAENLAARCAEMSGLASP